MSRYIDADELLKAMDTWDKYGYTHSGCFVREPENDDYVPYVHYEDMVKCVEGMPTADMVEVIANELTNKISERIIQELEANYEIIPKKPVVRCKDCKWFNDFGCAIRIVDESDKPREDDFCSFGERRTEDRVIGTSPTEHLVRCKECDKWTSLNAREGLCQVWSDFGISHYRYTPKDGYCSYGERREDVKAEI